MVVHVLLFFVLSVNFPALGTTAYNSEMSFPINFI